MALIFINEKEVNAWVTNPKDPKWKGDHLNCKGQHFEHQKLSVSAVKEIYKNIAEDKDFFDQTELQLVILSGLFIVSIIYNIREILGKLKNLGLS